MYIRYVINQYHCDKIKDYPHVHFYFQYIKTCLWLLVCFGDRGQKLSTLPCFHLVATCTHDGSPLSTRSIVSFSPLISMVAMTGSHGSTSASLPSTQRNLRPLITKHHAWNVKKLTPLVKRNKRLFLG